jgi:hypothetical protein
VWQLQAIPFVLGVGALGVLAMTSFMGSSKGKQFKSDYEALRKRVTPGARPAQDVVIDIEPNQVEDADIRRKYKEMDAELSDFDQELRRRKRQF